MLQRLLATSNDWAITVLRLVLGTVFFAHGAQKMLGWFGGPGFQGTLGMFQQQFHIPLPLAFLAICAEFFGGLGLLFGFLARFFALGVFVNMLVAVAIVHAPNGFFMNWAGDRPGEGFEFHLLALALCLLIVVRGAGAASIDLWLGGGLHRAAGGTKNRAA